MSHILNGYDLMALLCHKITLLSPELRAALFRSYCADPESAKAQVEALFPFLDRCNPDRVFLYNAFSPDELDLFMDQIDHWSRSDSDCKLLLYLLIYLDNHIHFNDSFDYFIKSLPTSIPHVVSFDSLNSNELECFGKLLPRLRPIWEKINGRSRASLTEDPFALMQNYFWIDADDTWEVNNVYSPKWSCDDGSVYTILCSPITNRPTFTFEVVNGEDCKYFNITEYHEEDQKLVLERFEALLAAADNQKAHMLLCPEMLASPKCQKDSQAIVKQHWEYSFPRILCLSSSEFKEDGQWKNQVQVLSDSGNVIFSYNKQQAFQLDCTETNFAKDGSAITQTVKYFEPITPDHKLTVMHVKGVGRIGLMICADIFNKELCNILLEKYEVRLLLIMAYTSGYDQFFREISAAQITSCDVVWCNACAAYSKSRKEFNPAVKYFPYGHRNSTPALNQPQEDNHKLSCNPVQNPYCDNSHTKYCCTSDGSLCSGCFSVITIDPTYDKPGSMVSSPLRSP